MPLERPDFAIVEAMPSEDRGEIHHRLGPRSGTLTTSIVTAARRACEGNKVSTASSASGDDAPRSSMRRGPRLAAGKFASTMAISSP